MTTFFMGWAAGTWSAFLLQHVRRKVLIYRLKKKYPDQKIVL